MFDPSLANIITKTTSLTNATPAQAAVVAAKAGMRFLITSIVISSNDTANPLTTIDDSSTTNPCCAVYASSTPATPYFGVPYKATTNTSIRATCAAITAAKTVEVSISGFYVPAS